MTIAWISLLPEWDMSSVQAALNVIISAIGTVGVWCFSRFWWQKSCIKILRNDSGTPLPSLCTITSPGEGWDAFMVLRRQIFSRTDRHLLFQLIVVMITTLACVFAGPIAKYSLRSASIIQIANLQILRVQSAGDGFTSNNLEANVLWNDTIQSLDQAQFPTDQLLDILPPLNASWTYVSLEWNPSWTMTCTETAETVVENVIATGNSTLYEPLDAFPAYRDTYSSSWLDESKYRRQADWSGWTLQTGEAHPPLSDVMWYILLESDPEFDNRMHTNNETLEMSLSVVHARGVAYTDNGDVSEGSATTWEAFGSVDSMSYVRVECSVAPNPRVGDGVAMAWPWTNDTYSITMGYRTYWMNLFEENAAKNLSIPMPKPHDILRFYQAYLIGADTIHSSPTFKPLSVWKDTVQLSLVFLVFILILTSLILWQTGRYFYFLRRNKSKLAEMYIPDGKMEWMIYSAKTSANDEEALTNETKKVKDRDYFHTALFGYDTAAHTSVAEDASITPPNLARVYTTGSVSVPGAKPKFANPFQRKSSMTTPVKPVPPSLVLPEDEGLASRDRMTRTATPKGSLAPTICSIGDSSTVCSRDHSPHPFDKNALDIPRSTRGSSATLSRPLSSSGQRAERRDVNEITLLNICDSRISREAQR